MLKLFLFFLLLWPTTAGDAAAAANTESVAQGVWGRLSGAVKKISLNARGHEEVRITEKEGGANSESGGKQFAGNAIGFAVRAVAIRAGINVLSQAVSKDGEVNLGEAMSFVTEPRFWTGSVGAFLGSMMGSAIGNMIFPGGGALLSALPGFMGAAAGYELGAGNIDRTDWTQLFASSAASALAFGAIGGPLGIVASVAAGLVINKLFDKSAEKELMPALERRPEWLALESPLNNSSDEPLVSFSGSTESVAGYYQQSSVLPIERNFQMDSEQSSFATTGALTIPQTEIDELMEKVRYHYENYIRHVRERNSSAASSEYDAYSQYKNQLDAIRIRYNL